MNNTGYTMKNKLTLITLTLLLTFTLTMGLAAANQPGIPNAFYGTVTVEDGQSAHDGLEILAQVQQQTYTTTTENGEYSLIVENPNQDNNGNTVTFFVEGQQVASAPFSNDETVTNLNLEASHVEFQEADDEDDSNAGSGSSGSSGGAGGSGGGAIGATDETTEEESDSESSSSTTSETEQTTETTQEETQEEQTTSDTDQTQEDTSTEVEEEQQTGAGFLAPITGFVTGIGEGATSLTGFFFLLIILIGLVGGYLFYKNRG